MTNDPLAGLHGPRRPGAPTGGADRAITAGRRRIMRRRTATTAAGVSVAVVAGAAFAGTRDGGSRSLDPVAPLPGPATSASASLPPLLPSVSPPAVPTLPPVTRAPRPAPTASTTALPELPQPDGRRWVGQTGRDNMTVRHENTATACTGSTEQASWAAQTGFCTLLESPATVTVGSAVSITVSLCRPNGMQAREVTFQNGYEVGINVARSEEGGDVEMWAWAHTEDFPDQPHTVTFQPGDCRSWTVRWAGQGNDGYALADGSYQVNGYPAAYDWTHEDGDDPMGPPPKFATVTVKS